MFKYKIKVVGWEYHIYRKKHWFGLWQDTGIHCFSSIEANKAIDHLNGVN